MLKTLQLIQWQKILIKIYKKKTNAPKYLNLVLVSTKVVSKLEE